MPQPSELGELAGSLAALDLTTLKNGIDVSRWNGNVDWKKVKETGILNADGTTTKVDFAYIKLTEGTAGRDKMAGFNAAECYRLGVPWGGYHYCTLNDQDEVRDAKAEAAYLIKRLSDLPPYQMPIALDVEDPKAILTDEELETWIRTFFIELIAAGHDNYCLYSYSPFLREHLPQNHSLSTVRLWAARYGGKLPVAVPGWGQNFWMHQYSNVGKVAGIQGNVDLNRLL